MTTVHNGARASRTVVLTCLAVTVLDGIDLLMFGAVLPVLLEDKEWGITSVEAGFIGSLSLFGMMIGAMLAGYLTDIVGRRPIVLACIAVFSIFTGFCAFAPSLELFGACRLIAGLGFGGALPTVLALTMEYVRVERRQFYSGVVQTGFPIGGGIIAIVAVFVIPAFGWRSLFAVAGLIGFVLFAVAYRNLPESLTFLRAHGRNDDARALAERFDLGEGAESAIALGEAEVSQTSNTDAATGFKALFTPGLRVGAFLFPLISFCGLLVAYGTNTWVPQMLRSAGYDLGSALSFLLAFSIGSAMGMVVLTGLADRIGSRRVISTGFACGAVAVAILTVGPAEGVVFGLILIVGFCSSSQSAVYGFAGIYYPSAARGTILGLSAGTGRLGGVIGPIMVGFIMGTSAGSTGAFWAFAIVGLVAALLVAFLPRTGLSDREHKSQGSPSLSTTTPTA